MSVLGSILSAIFGGHEPQQPRQTGSAAGQAAGQAGAAPRPVGAGAAGAAAGAMAAGAMTGTAAGAAQARPQSVDVEAVLSERAAKKHEKLNWRTSIVDLMKVLDLDSSMSARKELAHELGYKGELNGSAEMNMWLHKQVMQKVAANGGKVPAELTS